MRTLRRDIVIRRGATYYRTLSLEDEAGQPVDLTGVTARMQGRRRKRASAVLFNWTTAGGQIVIDAAAGSLTIRVDDTSTISGRGVYDLELEESDGFVLRLMQGVFEVNDEVTR